MARHSICYLVFALALGSCTVKSEKPKLYTVEIKDMKFVPDDITIKKGDTVMWINGDMMAHDVTEEGKAWTSSVIASGDSWKMEVTGAASYYCSIHMVMKGEINVK